MDEPFYVSEKPNSSENPDPTLEDLATGDRVERGKAERERMDKLLASIGEHEARIKELQKELADAMQAYKNAMLGTAAA